MGTIEELAFPCRMQQISMSQVEIRKGSQVWLISLVPVKDEHRMQKGCEVRTGLKLLEVKGRQEKQLEELEPVKLLLLGLWNGKEHLMAPKESHLCLEEQLMMPVRGHPQLTIAMFTGIHSRENVPVRLSDYCLFLQCLLPPGNGVIKSRNKSTRAKSWKWKHSLVSIGRTEDDEIEVLDWTRLFNNRKWRPEKWWDFPRCHYGLEKG